MIALRTTDGLTYPAANIPGYTCAAREFAFPDGVSEDTTKPIVISTAISATLKRQ